MLSSVKSITDDIKEIWQHGESVEVFSLGNRDTNHEGTNYNHEGQRPESQHTQWHVILKKRPELINNKDKIEPNILELRKELVQIKWFPRLQGKLIKQHRSCSNILI